MNLPYHLGLRVRGVLTDAEAGVKDWIPIPILTKSPYEL